MRYIRGIYILLSYASSYLNFTTRIKLYKTIFSQVTVRNSNSHVPVFSHVLYDVDISENLAPGTRVTTVRARDNDQGIYGDVVYDIESEDLKDTFRIDSESGMQFFYCVKILKLEQRKFVYAYIKIV